MLFLTIELAAKKIKKVIKLNKVEKIEKKLIQES